MRMCREAEIVRGAREAVEKVQFEAITGDASRKVLVPFSILELRKISPL